MKVPSIVFGMVLLGLLVLKAEWIPLAIVLWVVWNVRRLLRSARQPPVRSLEASRPSMRGV